MLSKEDNELITRVGPGTGLGNLMRRYWIPVALSSELPQPDCAPIRTKVLGEKLVAFRDSGGRVGVLQEFCAHRRASLFLGRNEEHGLRCVYHGWKYDVDGKCLDQPNEPPEKCFKDKIRLTAYPTTEQGGVVWAYMGAPDKLPAPPNFEWTRVPQSHRFMTKTIQENNWLQALEGGIDSAHSSFLHRALGGAKAGGWTGWRLKATAPRQQVELTDYGFAYAAIRELGEQGSFVKVYHYVMPFHTTFAFQLGASGETYRPEIHGHMFVPMDDENVMLYNLLYRFGGDGFTQSYIDDMEALRGRGPGDQTADFRKVRNRDNDWLIDREHQKTQSFTGIIGINNQDHAVQESMGAIVDRTEEHLGTSDHAVVAVRLKLLREIRNVQAGGNPPALVLTRAKIRAIEKLLPNGVDWREALKPELYPD
jgi:nitrite reductase/ring-hydroxylating ferredoxin subunit